MLLTAFLVFALAVVGLITASVLLSRQGPQDQDSRGTRWLSMAVVAGSLLVFVAFVALLIAVATAIAGDG
jgi:hypothetical protein